MNKVLIVTRHPAAEQFIREEEGLPDSVECVATATPDQVRDCIVYGNLPLHLAAEAKMVLAVEFNGPPPRGQEYTAQDMRDAGASLRSYKVNKILAH